MSEKSSHQPFKIFYFVPIMVFGIIGGFMVGSLIGRVNNQLSDKASAAQTVFSDVVYISNFQKEQPDLASEVNLKTGVNTEQAPEVEPENPVAEEPKTVAESKVGIITKSETRKVVKFNTTLSATQKKQIEKQYGVKFTADVSNKGVYTVTTTSDSDLASLSNDQKVSGVETDEPIMLLADTIDWGVTRINAPQVWEAGNTGSSQLVAVIDTGIQVDHPDLKANIVTGFDFVNNDEIATDDNGHGTHAAGIVAAAQNELGTVGTGHQVKLMPVKVLNESGYGYLSDVAKGIYFAADNGAKVINLSLGTTSDSSVLRDAVSYAERKGVLVVAAAGNSYGAPCLFPAAYDSAICVGATDKDNKLASFSNTGAELVAPGVSNYSTYKNSTYAYLSGTSMASPHVAGAAALILQDCGCTAAEARQILRDSAVDLGEVGRDVLFGYGLIDVLAATVDPEPVPEEPTTDPTPTEPTPTEPDSGTTDPVKPPKKDEPKPSSPKRSQKIDITDPEKNRTKVTNSIEKLEIAYSMSPVTENSDLVRVVIYVDDEAVFTSTSQKDQYEWNIEKLSNGQYVIRAIAEFKDGSIKHDRKLVDIQRSDANLQNSRANPLRAEQKRVRGITTTFEY